MADFQIWALYLTKYPYEVLKKWGLDQRWFFGGISHPKIKNPLPENAHFLEIFRPRKSQIPNPGIRNFSGILIRDFSASKIPNPQPGIGDFLGIFSGDF